MRKTKKFAAILLSTLILSSSFSILPVSAATLGSGTQSVSDEYTNSDYEYEDDYNSDGDGITITKYVGSESNVIIPDTIDGKTVIRISYNAFEDCTNLKSVTIPDSVVQIDWAAFRGCINLENIKIPDTITSIGTDVFEDTKWYSLQPDGIIKVGKVLYRYKGNAAKNTTVIVPNGIETIAERAFYNSNNIIEIKIPNSVTTISDGAFSYCNDLSKITIPKTVETIGINPFEKDNKLTSIEVENGNDNYYTYDGMLIGKSTTYEYLSEFEYTSHNSTTQTYRYGIGTAVIAYPAQNDTESIEIPENIIAIESNAFSNCKAKKIYLPDTLKYIDSYAFSKCDNLTSIKLPSSLISIGNDAFASCDSISNIDFSNTEISLIGSNAFYSENIKSVTFPARIGILFSDSYDDNNVFAKNTEIIGYENTEIQKYANNNGYKFKSLGKLYANDTIVSGDYSYRVCKDNTAEILNYFGSGVDIVIPEKIDGHTVTSIGDYAFSNNSKIESVMLSDSITSIGWYSFYECSNLYYIYSKNTEKIGSFAFYGCQDLIMACFLSDKINYWYSSDNSDVIGFGNDCLTNNISSEFALLLKIDNKQYLAYTILDNNTVEIKKYINKNNIDSNIKITIPNKIKGLFVSSIGAYAFNFQSLKNITIPNTITRIDEGAFSNCDNLDNLNIPENVKYIGSYAFSDCINLKSINIPNGITTIETGTFSGCSNLSDITIPDSITAISYSAFLGCTALKKLTIPSSVTFIESQAIGYIYYDEKISDFKIYGYKNTAAETYAKENGFEFISLGEQILTGDANQDGIVNVKDVTYFQMHIAGNRNADGTPLIDETNKQLFDSIDMNNDGKLTVNDVTALQTYLAENN